MSWRDGGRTEAGESRAVGRLDGRSRAGDLPVARRVKLRVNEREKDVTPLIKLLPLLFWRESLLVMARNGLRRLWISSRSATASAD